MNVRELRTPELVDALVAAMQEVERAQAQKSVLLAMLRDRLGSDFTPGFVHGHQASVFGFHNTSARIVKRRGLQDELEALGLTRETHGLHCGRLGKLLTQDNALAAHLSTWAEPYRYVAFAPRHPLTDPARGPPAGDPRA